MKLIAIHKRRVLTIPVVILLLLGCNSGQESGKEKPSIASTTEKPHSNTIVFDNEVNSEAPDAKSKTEQGYARPHHDHEMAQSPINIISHNADKAGKDQLSVNFHSVISAVENLGHTIQIDFREGSTCIVNGKGYSSKQFHFHTPSEHLVDGMTFPMEMHIVSILNDSNKTEKPSYLVVAVLFKMGVENNFLKEFLNKVPDKEGDKNELSSSEVKLEDLLSQIPKNEVKTFYTYKGSLTTPPYTESVQWIILKHVIEASEEQIMRIEEMEGNNARHVQALNARKVYTQ